MANFPNPDCSKIAAYRTRNRLPVLSWIHPETGAALLRSSQPTVGLTEKKSVEDFEYLKQIRDLRYGYLTQTGSISEAN